MEAQDELRGSIREALDQSTQHVLRMLRDRAPECKWEVEEYDEEADHE